MRDIESYIVLSNYTAAQLTNVVNTYIDAGWQPYGKLHVTGSSDYPSFVQAVVKYKPVSMAMFGGNL